MRRLSITPRALAWLGAAVTLAGWTIFAYWPAWHGGFIWDDDRYVTHNYLLIAPDGLRRIWFSLDAPSQYFPLAYTVLRIERSLWDLNPVGYHWVNILLHLGNALLVWCILARLKVPGAWLAAAIFALHPVQVESVAWISELKNTLSGVFVLLSLLCYLRFDDRRDVRDYAASFALFVVALLSKSVTATLPGVLLVLAWWRRGAIDWRRDVLPTLPFLAAGAAGGLFTAWVERTYIGAEGAEFHLTAVERVLVAGRAFWFYLWKIVWPVDLIF